MSGGLTPCRQLRPSSRREHVKASKSYMEWKKKKQWVRFHEVCLVVTRPTWPATWRGLHVGSARRFGGSIGTLVTKDADMARKPAQVNVKARCFE